MNIHHTLAKESGGADRGINKSKVNEYYHKVLHMLVKTMPPHMIIQFIIKITGKCLKEEIKIQINDILNSKEPENLYQEGVIKDIEKFKKACHKYLWIDYIKS